MSFNKDNFKSTFIFAVILGVFGFVTFDSGAFNHIMNMDFEAAINAYSTYDFSLSKADKSTGKKKKSNKAFRRTSYTKFNIPKGVLEGAKNNPTWNRLFTGNEKVLFYIIDDKNTDSMIKQYVSTAAPKFYKVQSYNYRDYMSINSNVNISSDICNSLQECNEMRKRASKNSEMTGFMDRCGRETCIINPRTKQYIILHSKDYQKVTNAVYKNINW